MRVHYATVQGNVTQWLQLWRLLEEHGKCWECVKNMKFHVNNECIYTKICTCNKMWRKIGRQYIKNKNSFVAALSLRMSFIFLKKVVLLHWVNNFWKVEGVGAGESSSPNPLLYSLSHIVSLRRRRTTSIYSQWAFSSHPNASPLSDAQ